MAPVNNTTGNGAAADDANPDPAIRRIKETLLQGGITIQKQIGESIYQIIFFQLIPSFYRRRNTFAGAPGSSNNRWDSKYNGGNQADRQAGQRRIH